MAKQPEHERITQDYFRGICIGLLGLRAEAFEVLSLIEVLAGGDNSDRNVTVSGEDMKQLAVVTQYLKRICQFMERVQEVPPGGAVIKARARK